MASRNHWIDGTRSRNRLATQAGRMRGRRGVVGLPALGLLAAAALVLAAGSAEAQNSGSQSGNGSGSNFSVGFDEIQLDTGGGGTGDGGGKRLRLGTGSPGGGGAKQHGMNFGDMRERCFEDEAFRRRNSTTCKHLLD